MPQRNRFRQWVLFWLVGVLALLPACTAKPPEIPALTSTPTQAAPTATVTSIPPTQTATRPAPTNTTVPTATPQVLTPPEHPVTGIELHSVTQPIVDLVKEAGAYWVRRNGLYWSEVEPQEGQRNWGTQAKLDQELQLAASQGLQVILVVQKTPAWAQKVPGALCGPVKSDKLEAFASFMHDLVARYSTAPFNVRYFELANEPDIDPKYVAPDSLFGCWGDETDEFYGGGYYAEMLKAVTPQIKAADPQAQVVVGGLLLSCDPVNPPEASDGSGKVLDCKSSRFLEGVLQAGGGDFFDAVSFHAYDIYRGALGAYGNPDWNSLWNTTGPVLIAKARYLRSVLAAYGHPDKELINTEVAVLCLAQDVTKCQSETFSNTKAYFAAQAYASAQAEGLLANVWYSISGWRYSQLVDKGLQPLPVLTAIQASAREVGRAAYVGEIKDYPGVKGYIFERDGVRVWIVWSLDGEQHQIELPEAPAAIYDVFGDVLPTQNSLNLDVAPVYVEFSP